MRDLTSKEEMFCRKYLETLNQKEAYENSYDASKMTDASIRRKATIIFNKPHVQERIAELMKERNERCEIDADYVLKKLVEMDDLDIADILNDDGSIKPISKWPKVWRTSVNALDVVKIINGEDSRIEIKKLKLPDKLKTKELIGKHVNVGAFKENINHSSDDGSMTPTIIELVAPSINNNEKN